MEFVIIVGDILEEKMLSAVESKWMTAGLILFVIA
jgi:hypothetical protein